jgi:hypothetical protein
MKQFKKDYYEKLFAKKDKTISDYEQIITHAQGKIQEIQSKCDHSKVQVGMYMFRPGSVIPTKICMSCNAPVEGITQEETDKAWADWNKTMQQSFFLGEGLPVGDKK